jgi:hypothetical protein
MQIMPFQDAADYRFNFDLTKVWQETNARFYVESQGVTATVEPLDVEMLKRIQELDPCGARGAISCRCASGTSERWKRLW